ncbi:RIP metalloprotease RseP [Thiospirochaeta perfilievii]|uniref:Zinc metalloprotease n=1 Tax=Thiospirochaeta perfilievii TaxID=252967 RepID=A0A5C1QDG4_9SPIO|nr:RIP metalloprotease RseP [Thiospirochaeta perfilievii]QEN06125.1 RIP metalloprotease RseP [Thiospirochaeta perfilievii]
MIIKYLIPLLALSLVIAIHELGHLIAGKLFKVKVEVYSIGIGKKLLTRQFGETEYALSLIPLGGYCKLKGGDIQNPNMDSDSMDFINPLKRAIIYFAGPFFNLILTIIFLSIVFMLPINQILPTTVLPVLGDNLPAEISGMKKGDQILSINGNDINSFLDISKYLTQDKLDLIIERDDRVISLELEAKKNNGQYVIGVYPYIPLNVFHSQIEKIKSNDKIIMVNSINVDNYMDLYKVTDGLDNFNITVIRDNKQINLTMTPQELSRLQFTQFVSYNPVKSTIMGFKNTFSMLDKIFYLFADLFKNGDVSKSISSPLRLVYDVGNSIDTVYSNSSLLITLETFLTIIASISLTLGFINLLPIPVLDGGQILFNIITLIKGSPLNSKFIYGYQTIGLIIILLLFTLGIGNDIFYFGDL